MQKFQSLWNSVQLKSRNWRDFQYGKYMCLWFEFMRIFRISSKLWEKQKDYEKNFRLIFKQISKLIYSNFLIPKIFNFQNFPKVISKYRKLWICPDIKSNLTSKTISDLQITQHKNIIFISHLHNRFPI